MGENCKYNGKNNTNEKIIEFLKDKDVILVCPEVLGGMSIPRLKSEILSNSKNLCVINENNEDVTKYFVKGAEIALNYALNNDVKLAIVKEKSPSCGLKKVYDGKFDGTLVDGQGVFTRKLIEIGINVLTEEDFL